jgi:hypothetical protein
MREYWENDSHLIELLLDSKMSIKEMAEDIKVTETFIHQRVKALGLDWILRQPRKISRGQTALTNTLKKILPNETIVNEFYIGEKLRLDIYCPTYKIAIEYHGRQHFEYVPHFHGSYEEFVRSKERDERKESLCKENGIALIVFRYCDDLSEEIVYNRVLDGIKNSSNAEIDTKQKKSLRDNAQYQELKAKKNAYQRELRKKIKREQKENEKTRAQKVKDEYGLDESS